MAESLKHRTQIPRHDASLEAIRAVLFSFFGVNENKQPGPDKVKQDMTKSTFAKSKLNMDAIWSIEKDATRRLAEKRAKL